MNTETASMIPPNKNWIDKIIGSLEILSLVLMAFPFGCIALWILASEFLVGDYFFFFPTAMFTFLPAGLFALFVQLFRIVSKRPSSLFSTLLFRSSIITIIIGILAWMAIFVATG